MADDGSITISARGALITGLISIVLSPFALVLGYYVNRIVAGPKTAVVDTSAVPIHKIDPKVVALFYKDAGVLGTFSSAFGGPPAVAGATQDAVNCQSWLHNGGILDDRCIVPVRNWAQATFDYNVAAIPQYQNGTAPPQGGLTKDNYITFLTDMRDAADALRTEFAHFDDADSGKTGDTVFYVVMLNTGDGDDILYPNAEVRFDGGKLYLKSGEYATVKSHSFQQTRYEIDRGTTPGDDLKAWAQFVRLNAGTQFTITVYLGKDRSSTGTSRVKG